MTSPRESQTSRVARAANLGLAFLLELAMLAALVVWAFSLSIAGWLQVIIAIGSLAVVGTLWARFAAPTSARRLRGSSLRTFKIVVFAVGALALILAGHVVLAILYAVVVAINLELADHWHQ